MIVFLLYNIDLIKGPARHRAVTRFIECLTHSKYSSNVRYYYKEVGSIYQRETCTKTEKGEKREAWPGNYSSFSQSVKLGR